MTTFLIVSAIVVGFVILTYNRLVSLRQTTKNAFADIDVMLKQRHDLIPNLLETVKGYASHESSVFAAVTAARANAMKAATVQEKTAAEGALNGALMSLYAVAENYPQLKANENFLALQNSLSDLEYKLSASRRFYNNAVAEYNSAIAQFPAVLFAKKFGFEPTDMYALDEAERIETRQPPKVQF